MSVTPTSGQAPTYVDQNGGSASIACQGALSYTLPSGLAAGTYSATTTVYDGDGEHDTYTSDLTVVTSPTEPGGTAIPIVTPPPTAQVIASLIDALAGIDNALTPALWPGCDANHVAPRRRSTTATPGSTSRGTPAG